MEQQDREQPDKQTEGNTSYVHKATLLGEFCIDPASRSTGVLSPGVDRLPARSLQTVGRRLAEKPKIGKLQMDWLRSEDLKEEKNVTAPMATIAVEEPIASVVRQGLRGTSEQ